MDTLADLRNKDNPMEPDRARAVATVASVMIDSAKVEIDYLKVTGYAHSQFLGAEGVIPSDGDKVQLTRTTTGLPNGISSVTRHRLGV